MGYTMIYRQVDYFNTHIVFHQNYAMCFLSGTLVEMAAAARPSEWVQRIWRSLRFQEPVPSGKRLQNYGKSRCSMGKSTFSMVIFNSYISHYQRVNDNVAKVISPNTQPILQYCHRLVVQIIPKPWACHQVYHIPKKIDVVFIDQNPLMVRLWYLLRCCVWFVTVRRHLKSQFVEKILPWLGRSWQTFRWNGVHCFGQPKYNNPQKDITQGSWDGWRAKCCKKRDKLCTPTTPLLLDNPMSFSRSVPPFGSWIWQSPSTRLIQGP